MQHPALPLLLIGVPVIGTVALLLVDRANNGQHAWSPGAAFRAPAGDPTTVTRHAWCPGAGEHTIRVDVLVRRIAEERRPGKHALDGDPPAVDERQADERQAGERQAGEGRGDVLAGQLHTHYPLLTHAVAA